MSEINNSKNIYFASDQHFGIPSYTESLEREKLFVKWLDEIKETASEIFLLGDLFDFWFEYKYVVPKGFVRLLGKLAEISDSGIPIHFFVGNHDMWVRDYFSKELGIQVYKERTIFKRYNKSFLIGHGDGLGPNDKNYKRLKRLFKNSFAQWLFKWIHPDFGIPIGVFFSTKNKLISGNDIQKFYGNKEWLIKYCQLKLKHRHFDFFLFGHRHVPYKFILTKKSVCINLGDWINHMTYAVFDGNTIKLEKYSS